MKRIFGIICTLLIPVAFLVSQVPPPPAQGGETKSLGDLAREARSAKPPTAEKKTRIVVDDEHPPIPQSTIPDVAGYGPLNTEAVVAAIKKFKSAHTAEETELEVHSWYDANKNSVQRLNQENVQIARRGNQRMNPKREEYPRDYDEYKKLEERQDAAKRVTVDAYEDGVKNTELMRRICLTTNEVKPGLWRMGLNYSWYEDCSLGGGQMFSRW